jgi:dihydrofolate reductase
MPITLVVAKAANNCIGNASKLPWRIPEDAKHFRDCTIGKTVLMGRKTWESLPPKFRPLPNRKNVVVTRDQSFMAEGAIVFHDLQEALQALKDEEVCIGGGAEIYKECLPFANKIELTQIHKEYDGDTFFPEINLSEWKVTKEDKRDGFSFLTYERTK